MIALQICDVFVPVWRDPGSCETTGALAPLGVTRANARPPLP